MVGPFVDVDSDGIVYAKCRFVACSGKSYKEYIYIYLK